ncbi:aminotransferase class III-fold pyridoxal phosphate-dependent enzyme [Nakamurella lactea]|uniref:aminotransferase class III-fold pyridoxal phosphate-dependent enzyme n=1 Tax=Nakamurella lactea TaxID=459515 RepID=UPI00040691D8|nr:aminotransferase class III-fold pyridoxal phosphate-dependent enzyme [Nakamurella lactea]
MSNTATDTTTRPTTTIGTLLGPLRSVGGARRTTGLDDVTLERFAATDPRLLEATEAAVAAFQEIAVEFGELIDLDEDAQCAAVQAGYVNFYPQHSVNPYVALVGRGPWLITLKGAVLFDAGGYGMLGFGHPTGDILEAMARPQVMANVMTPSISQLRFERAITAEIGHTRSDGCPFTRFMCLNSGSEATGLAARIVDTNAKTHTDPDGEHPGATIKRLVVSGSFHGRTDRPALYSDSSRKDYDAALASFRGDDSVIVIEPYDEVALKQAFADAEANNHFIEAVFLEPVMGEGDPGRALPPSFYALARELTAAAGSLLLIDSIQAGLRCHGVLSVVDYPGFGELEPPDLETYSKALNAGQYPFSVLALTDRAAAIYRRGTYGNTMTTNPRALEVASRVLGKVTDEVRTTIRERGTEALARLTDLQAELPGAVTKVQGTGLLFSCELSPAYRVVGDDSTEVWLREHGLGVIHGGENSLRFTPPFDVTSDQLELLVSLVERALRDGPRAG